MNAETPRRGDRRKDERRCRLTMTRNNSLALLCASASRRSLLNRKFMNPHYARLLALGIVTSGWAGSLFAQNRTSPQRRQQNGQPAAADAGPQQRPRPTNNESAQDTAAGMRRHGSSLLRATMHARSDAAQARLADVSFHAVPEPIPKTLRKHDQVTIIVREESEFRSKGKSEFSKEAEFEARVEEFVRLQVKNMEIQGGAQGATPPALKVSG